MPFSLSPISHREHGLSNFSSYSLLSQTSPSFQHDHGRRHFPDSPNQTSPSETIGLRYATPDGSPLLTPADSSSLSVNYSPYQVWYQPHLTETIWERALRGAQTRRWSSGANGGDYGSVQGAWFGSGSKKPALRWTTFKWIMSVANIVVRPLFIRFSVLPLNIRFAVDDLLPRFLHFLPAHVAPRLGSS